MDRLAHKVAIVTGSGTRSTNVTGVGMATAKLFASHGASVLIVDMNESAAKITEKAIHDAGGQASIFIGDVAKESVCKELVKTAVARYGKLDILMNSVAIGGPGTVTEISEDFWDRVLDVDL
ncbi:MAG: short-chain dehydrogenase, partial [Chloroflexi bacterium]|nr:short-chain dehydrogenase [Chloroflexota bacterium]